jgi:two-component system response regulator AlgR
VNPPAFTLRVLIVDDEELARMRLRGLVEASVEPRAMVVGEAANAAQAMVWLQQHGQGPESPDGQNACHLVLLDVHMPGRDGMQLAEELRRLPTPPAVVFVTAHADHALKAFELEAVDYLTKPVRPQRLEQALQRVAARLGQPQAAAAPARLQADEPALVVSELGRVIRVPLAEVLYLKAELKYVTLRTASRTLVLDEALSDLEQRLGPRFLRIHRNALVARSAMRALERRAMTDDDEPGQGDGWAVCISPVDEWLAVSRRQMTAVREAIEASGL